MIVGPAKSSPMVLRRSGAPARSSSSAKMARRFGPPRRRRTRAARTVRHIRRRTARAAIASRTGPCRRGRPAPATAAAEASARATHARRRGIALLLANPTGPWIRFLSRIGSNGTIGLTKRGTPMTNLPGQLRRRGRAARRAGQDPRVRACNRHPRSRAHRRACCRSRRRILRPCRRRRRIPSRRRTTGTRRRSSNSLGMSIHANRRRLGVVALPRRARRGGRTHGDSRGGER